MPRRARHSPRAGPGEVARWSSYFVFPDISNYRSGVKPLLLSRSRRPRGGASVHAAGAAGPVGLAELELLELAGGGADQGVPDLDRGRALVVRHAAPAVLHQVPLGATGARAQDHERLDRLAPLLVGHADHRDL